jgi:hypothetical protein
MEPVIQEQLHFLRILLPRHIEPDITQACILKTNHINRVSCRFFALQLSHVVLPKKQQGMCWSQPPSLRLPFKKR